MSLLCCPDCGGKVSNSALVCPHCGCPAIKFKKPTLSKNATSRTCKINGRTCELKKVKNYLCKINGRQYDLKSVEKAIKANNVNGAEIQVMQMTKLSLAATRKLVRIIQETEEIPREFDLVKHGFVSNLPKCPVCGSTRLTKITAVGRLATGFVYGGLSPEGRAQYVCQNCDYKF